MPVKYNGVISSFSSFAYLLTTILTGHIIHWLPKRVFVLIAFCGTTVGLFLMGPSSLLGLPDHLWIFIVGYTILGAAQGFAFIPILPEVIDSIYDHLGIDEGESEANDNDISDRASSLYGSFYYIGMMVSPVVGSLVYSSTKSFNKTCDVFALFSLFYTVFFFLINILPDVKTLTKKKQQ